MNAYSASTPEKQIIINQRGRWDWGAVYSRSFYKLGRVYEEMGKKDEARKEYAKFLDLWKDADLGLPEVEDARKKLNLLS